MQLYTVKNNETGETKGLDLTATVDLIYFDTIKEEIARNSEDYDEDEIADLMTSQDMAWHFELRDQVNNLSEEWTIGRYTVTPLI